jgi:hypothetical protein
MLHSELKEKLRKFGTEATKLKELLEKKGISIGQPLKIDISTIAPPCRCGLRAGVQVKVMTLKMISMTLISVLDISRATALKQIGALLSSCSPGCLKKIVMMVTMVAAMKRMSSRVTISFIDLLIFFC